jgi:raffinose/stachyose/melibiose transport system permease protein
MRGKGSKGFKVSGYLFILPALLFFVCFIVYPVVFVVFGSFYKWSTLANIKFVGIGNYLQLFHDDIFKITLRNTCYWIVITVFTQMLIGFALAYIIEEKLRSMRLFFRTLFVVPVVTSVVVIAIVWSNMYSPYQGLITNFFYRLGFHGPFNWLGSVNGAIFAIIVVNIWEWTGWSMVLYIAGISEISVEIKEAARIDGISGFSMIWYIFLPLLSHVHKSLIMLGLIGSLQTFALVYSMTGGGPNSASEMPGTYIFRTGFKIQQMGYASAISVTVLGIALAITVLQIVVLRSGNLSLREESR